MSAARSLREPPTIRAALLHALLLALSVLLAPSADAQQPSAPPASEPAKSPTPAAPPPAEVALEPKAIDILKASSERLAAARTMSLTAVASYESPSRLGPALIYTTRSQVTLQRPDKLRVIQEADAPASEFYYDGKTMVAFSPAESLVATAEAPPTIDTALETAYLSAAIYFPFTDVMVAAPYLLKGKPVFVWNLVDLKRVRWEGPEVLSPGKHTLEFDFKYDGLGIATLAFNNLSGIGRSGTGVLKVDGKDVATQKMERTLPLILQWHEDLDVGADTGTPVDDKDYQVPFKFTGKLEKLTLKIDRPRLTPEDEKRLREAQRNNRASE